MFNSMRQKIEESEEAGGHWESIPTEAQTASGQQEGMRIDLMCTSESLIQCYASSYSTVLNRSANDQGHCLL